MLVRLLTLFLFLACWAQTAFADSRATILSTPLTNDGDEGPAGPSMVFRSRS